MTKKQKKLLKRLIVSTLLFIAVLILPLVAGWIYEPAQAYLTTPLLSLILHLIPYLTIGLPVLIKAFGNIRHGQLFDENFLMTLATVGALAIGEYPEAVFVLLFYEVGELFESLAVGRSRQSIAALMDIRPETATVIRDGKELVVSPEEVLAGETLILRPGDRVPLDGEVLEGRGCVNTVAMTGESKPRDVSEGDTVWSGFVNETGILRIRVTKPYGESTATKLLRLVEESANRKAPSEAFITRFSGYYTPAVVLAALLAAVLPPLFDGAWQSWIYRALSFLVISCPCALVISVPLSFFAGIGAASRNGILVKGSVFLERLATCRTVVFDKTGTLTEGSFTVTDIHALSVSKEELLRLAASAERYATHPIARSLKRACGEEADRACVEQVTVMPGRGLSAVVDRQTVIVGNQACMEELGLVAAPLGAGTAVHVARREEDGYRYLGVIGISDRLKPQTAEALTDLRKCGVKTLVMLTGDSRGVAEQIAQDLSIDKIHAELLPDAKVSEVERLLAQKDTKSTLVFVGDGINDAPVLSRADVGVAMGALGSDAAIEAADVVIMDDNLKRLGTSIGIARKTKRIVMQNIVLSLLIKLGVLLLSAFGLVSMWEAVFADVGVMVLAVLNAMRAMRS